MTIILADTGPLYAAYDTGDQYHKRALQEIQALNQQGLAVHLLNTNLCEVYSLVMYRFSPVHAQDFLKQMQQVCQIITPLPDDFESAFQTLNQYNDQKLSLFDGVLAAFSKRMNSPVWTYDFHFEMMFTQLWRV
ncbi:MAG: type II toxin-antitoxin system VapC family toxin [Candidatus Sericytochromatia bacterium]